MVIFGEPFFRVAHAWPVTKFADPCCRRIGKSPPDWSAPTLWGCLPEAPWLTLHLAHTRGLHFVNHFLGLCMVFLTSALREKKKSNYSNICTISEFLVPLLSPPWPSTVLRYKKDGKFLADKFCFPEQDSFFTLFYRLDGLFCCPRRVLPHPLWLKLLSW